MSSTPRLHPTPVTPRWPEVPAANSCYTSPPMHSTRYGNSSDMYTPLTTRRNSEYEHMQHFPGFAYINGEATTGWAKWKWLVSVKPVFLTELCKLDSMWDFTWTFLKGGEDGKDPGKINVVHNVGRLQTSVTECSCSRKTFLCYSRHLFRPTCAFSNSGMWANPVWCQCQWAIPPPLLLTNINEFYKKSTGMGSIYDLC